MDKDNSKMMLDLALSFERAVRGVRSVDGALPAPHESREQAPAPPQELPSE